MSYVKSRAIRPSSSNMGHEKRLKSNSRNANWYVLIAIASEPIKFVLKTGQSVLGNRTKLLILRV